MKSQLTFIMQAWVAALFDAAASCALKRSDVERDIITFGRQLYARGLGFVTLDLPSLDEALLSYLERGALPSTGHLLARRRRGNPEPRFLNAFWKLVLDERVHDASHVNAVLAIRQLACFFKKLEVPCSASRMENAANEYRAIESRIRPPTLRWEEDQIDLEAACLLGWDGFNPDESDDFLGGAELHPELHLSPRDAERLTKVAGILVSELGPFDAMSDDSETNGFFKHGPGAVANAKGRSYKYDFPSWPQKLERVFPFDWCSGASFGEYPRSTNEVPSRLLAVPKTAKGPRLIAAEPIEHQWCQQKVATWLDSAIRGSTLGRFINLHDQSLSQRLVVSASRDRSLSTIDLSSASDRVSCYLVERLFKSNLTLLEAMHATRTRTCKDTILSGEVFFLRKFASMGSALTFPVQCVVFTIIALTACGAHDRRSIRALIGKVRVFGDDIIIPVEHHDSIVRLLTTLGLKVNDGKSFHRGFFRESCGMDSYRGHDVTPRKPKHIATGTPTHVPSLIDTSNNLFNAGYWRAAKVFEGAIPRFMREVVAHMSSGVAVLKCFSGVRVPAVKWDDRLHQHYTPVVVVENRDDRITQHSHSALREFFTRPWRPESPRVTGVRMQRAAKLAVRRVSLTALEGDLAS